MRDELRAKGTELRLAVENVKFKCCGAFDMGLIDVSEVVVKKYLRLNLKMKFRCV